MCAKPLGWPEPRRQPACLSVNTETVHGREPVEWMGALPVPGDSRRDREALEVLPAARLNQRGGLGEREVAAAGTSALCSCCSRSLLGVIG